mgnify:CR=1 FL=1
MRIRDARTADAADIAGIHVDSWRATYAGIVSPSYLAGLSHQRQKRLWRDVLSNSNRDKFLLVVENDDGKVLGFAFAGPLRDKDPCYAGELYAVYFPPECQRQGLGTKLIRAIAKRLQKVGIQSMLVWVLAVNPSCHFYEELGAIQVKRREIDVGGTRLSEIAYGLRDIKNLAKRAT